MGVGQILAGMLHGAVRVEQPGADDAHLGTLRVLQQRLQPVRLVRLDVVVEEQQVLAAGRTGAAIVETGPVERPGHVDDHVGRLG